MLLLPRPKTTKLARVATLTTQHTDFKSPEGCFLVLTKRSFPVGKLSRSLSATLCAPPSPGSGHAAQPSQRHFPSELFLYRPILCSLPLSSQRLSCRPD